MQSASEVPVGQTPSPSGVAQREQGGLHGPLEKGRSGESICPDWSGRLEKEGVIVPMKPPLN